jgi:arabinofuranosyltransferase
MSEPADRLDAVQRATAVERGCGAAYSLTASNSRTRSERWALGLLLSCFTLWCAWFVYRSSFLIGGQRFFCLFDDAMISMVYARNWVEGYGLNWARYGAPVEGYTHPLWMFWMAGLHWLPLPLRLQSLAVQITSWFTLVLTVLVVKRLVRRHFTTRSVSLSLPAAVLTATYYPLNQWALQGMESGLQALLICLAVLLSLDIGAGKRRETALMLVLTAGVLLRMDMAILVVIVLGVLVYDRHLCAQNLRRWVPGFSLFLAVNLGYTAFRAVYFHDWLPNTYYLKMSGIPVDVRILRGAIVFIEWLDIAAIPLLIVFVAVIPFLKRSSPFVLPTLVTAGFLAYSIFVGGDSWETFSLGANRFQAVVMPLVFALLNGLLNHGVERLERSGIPSFRGYVTIPVTLAFALLCNGLWLCKDTASHWNNAYWS